MPLEAQNQGAQSLALSGMTEAEIASACSFKEKYRAHQLYSWLARGASSFEEMSDLAKPERARLSSIFPSLYSSEVSTELKDEDGSEKLQIRLRDGAAVECVLLEDIEGRKTACVSSQVGCPMNCAFCKTGSLGYLRDLGPDEIMEQFYFLNSRRGPISNVVFMGMGEPLLNLPAVRKAIGILTDPKGIGMSRRKITISTSGVVPGILDLAENGPSVRLAVSLTAADDDLRSELMPINKKWNLAALRAALGTYQEKTGERITLEAALMAGRNTRPEDAEALVRWIGGLDVQINVIPWNSIPSLPFSEPSRAEVERFVSVLEAQGLTVNCRMHRGRNVMAACGQLGDTLKADRHSPD